MLIKSASAASKHEACNLEIEIDDGLRFMVEFPEVAELTNKDFSSGKFPARAHGLPKMKRYQKALENQGPDYDYGHHQQVCGKICKKPVTHVCSIDTFKEKMKCHYDFNDRVNIGRMTKAQLSARLVKMLPCIGCRKAVESFYDDLISKGGEYAKNGQPFEIFSKILVDAKTQEIKIDESILKNDDKFYKYIHVLSCKCKEMTDSLKMKSGKTRCALHSLDSRANVAAKSKFAARANQNSKRGHGECDGCDEDDYMGYNSVNFDDSNPLGYFGLGPRSTRVDMKKAWMTVLNSLTKQCKRELCTIDCSKLKSKLDDYLVRLNFCCECKQQVLDAYQYLIDPERSQKLKSFLKFYDTKNPRVKLIKSCPSSNETSEETNLSSEMDENLEVNDSESDSDSDACNNDCEDSSCPGCADINAVNPAMFSGIRFCENHIHVATDDDQLDYLLKKAETEMMFQAVSSGHNRHAKSMAQAQNQILIVVGMYIYERLQKVWLKVEDTSLAACLLAGIFCENMRQNYDELLNEKVGDSYIEDALKALGELGDEKSPSKSSKKREKKKQKKVNKKEKEAKKEKSPKPDQPKLQPEEKVLDEETELLRLIEERRKQLEAYDMKALQDKIRMRYLNYCGQNKV